MIGPVITALLILSRVFRALHDTGTHSPGAGKLAKWGPFWNSLTSWRLKYKNQDPAQGPAYPGATTWLVAWSDGWHLTNLLAWLCADAAVLLAAYTGHPWWALAGIAVGRISFEPLYAWLRK